MEILEDRLRDRTAEWCWRSQWLTGHDSSFGLLMKFAFLNALTAKDLAQYFINRTCKRRTAILRDVNVDLRDGQYFDYRALARALRTDERAVATSFLFSAFPNPQDSAGGLKWCEQCLAWGFHLSISQIGITNECPIHRRPLRNRCPQCDAVIPYALTPKVFENPFHCPECEFDLAPNMCLMRFDARILRVEDRAQIGRMTRYLATYASLSKRSTYIPTGLDNFPNIAAPRIEAEDLVKYLGFIGEVTSEAVSEGAQAGLGLEPVVRMRCGCGSRTIAERLFERLLPDRGMDHFGANAELQVAIGVYRAAKRLLWQKYVGRHRRCVRLACRHIWWNLRGATTPGICARAAAFIRWRMLWEGCSTPRYLDAKQKKYYFGILGWLHARPAPYPDDWPNERKAWMLAHVFYSVCMASFERIVELVEHEGQEGQLCWTGQASTVFAVTHWALMNGDRATSLPQLYLPARREPPQGGPDLPMTPEHWRWHRSRLASIVR